MEDKAHISSHMHTYEREINALTKKYDLTESESRKKNVTGWVGVRDMKIFWKRKSKKQILKS